MRTGRVTFERRRRRVRARALYWQLPATHACPGAQALPHAPQFAALVLRSAQMPEQSVVPFGQAQLPLAHTRLPAQIWEQNPQLLLSFVRSMHALPQRASPAPHET
jgi:hypothetical protein